MPSCVTIKLVTRQQSPRVPRASRADDPGRQTVGIFVVESRDGGAPMRIPLSRASCERHVRLGIAEDRRFSDANPRRGYWARSALSPCELPGLIDRMQLSLDAMGPLPLSAVVVVRRLAGSQSLERRIGLIDPRDSAELAACGLDEETSHNLFVRMDVSYRAGNFVIADSLWSLPPRASKRDDN